MDVTTTSSQTHNWELFAQLALHGQNCPPDLDTPTLIQQLTVMLQSYLPHSWGVLVGLTPAQEVTWDSWGLSDDEAYKLAQTNGHIDTAYGSLYKLRASEEEFGHLVLAPLTDQATTNQTFYYALAAQLALLLQTRPRPLNDQYIAEQEQRAAELRIAACISSIVTATMELSELAEQSYECLSSFFSVDTYTLSLYRADYNELVWHFWADTLSDTRGVVLPPDTPQPDTRMAQIIQTRQPVLLKTSDAGSWMGMPLLTGKNQVVGVVTLLSQHPDVYSQHDLALLGMAVSHLTIGVQNAQLLMQSEDQVIQLGLLNLISATAASAQEVRVIYQEVLDAMVQVTGVDQARLVLRDRETGVGHIVAEYMPTGMADQVTIPFADDTPAVKWLQKHLSPLVSYDAQNDPLLAPSHDTFQKLHVRSVALVPLVLNGEVLGSIGLDFVGRQARFSLQQLEFCQTIANHVTTVIEKDRLFLQAQANAHALQVKVGELSTLLESAGILGSILQPEEVLNSLTDLVSRQLRVSSVALWTINNDNILVPTAIYGLQVDHPNDLRLPVGKGVTGHVASTGLPLIIHDIDEDGRNYYPHFFGPDSGLTSYMGVPIFYRDQVIGVLSVMTEDRREFSSDEMMVLVGLAGQAAIALENARLFKERERRSAELTAINQISAAVNATLELDEMLMILHEQISEIVDTRCSVIGIYEEVQLGINDSRVLLRVVRTGGKAHLSNRSVALDGKNLIDYVVLHSKPLLLRNMDEIRNYVHQWRTQRDEVELDTAQVSALNKPFACWLGVPIMLGDDVLGVINLQSTEPLAFTTDNMRFLSTVASQAAVAIANARLYHERERRLRELSVLKDIGSAISSTQDVQTVLEHLRYELGQTVDMSTALIGLYDEQTDMLSYNICYDQGRRLYLYPDKLPTTSENANSWVIRNRQPLLLHNLDQGRQIGFRDFGTSQFEVRSGQSFQRITSGSKRIQSFLVVPIISGDTVLGVINIQSYQPYAFDQDDLRFVMTVANQAAVTIANVYLFMERERRIEELATFNEIGRALSATVSVDELPKLVYRQTSRLLDTTNFYIALVDEENSEITFPLFYDNGISYVIPRANQVNYDYIGQYRVPGTTPNIRHWNMVLRLTQRVINLGEPLIVQGADSERGGWITDISELREELGRGNPVTPHLWLGVPMIVADRVAGIMAVQNYERENAFGPDDVRLLSTIASAAAIALANSRLFEQISNLAAELEQRVDERTAELAEANVQLLAEKERLETVHAITLELTASLNLDEIIVRALQMASTNLSVARGSIMLRDPQSGDLICRAILQHQGVAETAHFVISFEKGDGLANWVIGHQEPVCIDDVRGDHRWIVESGRADEVRSVVAVPLMTSDTTLGVLILSSPRISHFTESQLRLLATIANEVAIAIHNAQLYSYITEMASRLAELLEHQKEETSKSRAIFQSMTEGLIVLDTDQHIVIMNSAAEHMLDITAADVLDQPLAMLKGWGQNDEQRQRAEVIYDTLYRGLQTATERQSMYSTSFELLDPPQIIAVNLSSVTSPDGRVYGDVAVMRDITREIEADRTKREFVSKVSHELRTPLTAIKGHVELLLMGVRGELNEQQTELVKVAHRNVKRLKALTDDILDISRVEAGKIELHFSQVDISAVVKDVVQSLLLEAEKKALQVQVEMEDNLPLIEADEHRLTQVVTNLFSNAIKYTFEGGHIHVRVFINPARLMQLEVADTGVGISPEDQKKLFRPFYRTDNPLRDQAGGTGLGLLIAKSLVELHTGEMWVTSELGKGSTFHFVLPFEQPEPEQAGDEDDQ